jgi:hypothetical protein
MLVSTHILLDAAALAFVLATMACVGYALIRPLTHFHYHRTGGKLWRPLD